MFIKKSSADEIMNSMEQHLIEAASGSSERSNKLIKAAEYLNTVAEIFDEAGLNEESEVVTSVLESLAGKKKKEVKKEEKDKKKDLSKDKEDKSDKKDKSKGKKLPPWLMKDKDGKVVKKANSEHDMNCADMNCADCGDTSYAMDDDIEALLEGLRTSDEDSEEDM